MVLNRIEIFCLASGPPSCWDEMTNAGNPEVLPPRACAVTAITAITGFSEEFCERQAEEFNQNRQCMLIIPF